MTNDTPRTTTTVTPQERQVQKIKELGTEHARGVHRGDPVGGCLACLLDKSK